MQIVEELSVSKPTYCAVRLENAYFVDQELQGFFRSRRYWFFYGLGQVLGPFLMALLKPKSISFGLQRPGRRFKWIEISWKD